MKESARGRNRRVAIALNCKAVVIVTNGDIMVVDTGDRNVTTRNDDDSSEKRTRWLRHLVPPFNDVGQALQEDLAYKREEKDFYCPVFAVRHVKFLVIHISWKLRILKVSLRTKIEMLYKIILGPKKKHRYIGTTIISVFFFKIPTHLEPIPQFSSVRLFISSYFFLTLDYAVRLFAHVCSSCFCLTVIQTSKLGFRCIKHGFRGVISFLALTSSLLRKECILNPLFTT